MKQILILALACVALSCQKKEVTPVGEPIKLTNAIGYRIEGINSADTTDIYLNGKKLNPTYGYDIAVKPGDSLKIYYTGNFRQNTGFNLAYWPLDNKGATADQVVTLKAKRRTWLSHIEYIDQITDPKIDKGGRGTNTKDSILVYGWRYYIKETIIF